MQSVRDGEADEGGGCRGVNASYIWICICTLVQRERQPAAEWTAVGLEGSGDCSRATLFRRSGWKATGDVVKGDGDTEGGGALGRGGGVGSVGGAQTGRKAAFEAVIAVRAK
jgi:hypothetical protein